MHTAICWSILFKHWSLRWPRTAVEGRAAVTCCPGTPSTVSRQPWRPTHGLMSTGASQGSRGAGQGLRGRPGVQGGRPGVLSSREAPWRFQDGLTCPGCRETSLGSVYCILIILYDFSLRFNDFDKYAVTKR